MPKKDKTQSIFVCEESEDAEPIVFHVPASYNKRVKIHDWQMHTLAEPRDNAEFFPPKGNLHKSSYRRLGPDDRETVSETHAMLSQIELKDQYEPIYPQRSLLTMHSFALTDKQEKDEDLRVTDVLLDPDETRRMDYGTTMGIDYRLPYPIKPKPPAVPPPPEPWLLNRRTIGYSLQDLEKRDGVFTFLDDNMQLHRKIAELKAKRNNLYETLKHFTWSDVPEERQ